MTKKDSTILRSSNINIVLLILRSLILIRDAGQHSHDSAELLQLVLAHEGAEDPGKNERRKQAVATMLLSVVSRCGIETSTVK